MRNRVGAVNPRQKGKHMSYYKDHIKAVAKRQATKMQNDESEESIRKYLLKCGWEQHEVEKIMQAAGTYKRRGE